jgi:hypothetical protein
MKKYPPFKGGIKGGLKLDCSKGQYEKVLCDLYLCLHDYVSSLL